MFTVVRKSEAKVRQITKNKIARNFITKEISPNVSFAVTEAEDHEEVELAECDRIYYVLDGKLILMFNDKKVSLEKDDCCFVNSGTRYKMTGTFKAIMINQPAYGMKKLI